MFRLPRGRGWKFLRVFLLFCDLNRTRKVYLPHPNDYGFMAVRILQLCLVFAVGFPIGPATALNGSSRAICNGTAPPLSAPPNQSPKHNISIHFLQEPIDQVAIRGQNVTLQCLAISTAGNVTISWLYEGEPVPDEDPRWMLSGSELLLLRIASNENTGVYSCLASNGYGAVLSRVAKIKVATLDKEAVVLAGNTTIYETQSLLLQCIIHSTPPAEIHWEFNQLPLPKDKRYVPLPNGALLIRNTNFSDSGKYRCIAENSVLNKAKSSKDLDVSILPTPTKTVAPSIQLVNSSVYQTVLIGDTVEFVCIASGWPTPSVKWQNDKNTTLGVSSILTIRNARPEHSGNLTCIASNDGGNQVQLYHLNVFQEPCFNKTPVSLTSPLVQTVRIDCQARGIPQPKILWLKNGRPLAQEIRVKRPYTGLVFSHTISTDSGLYQCIAVNEVGRVWTAAQLEINNSQSPSPPQNIQCRPYDDDKICLTWKKPDNVSVKAYSVYSFYLSQGVEEPGPEYLIEDTFKLAHGLKQSTNYTFYVRLYSNHASDHSEKVTCQTGFKGSRNLDIETMSTTEVKLNWDKLSSDILCNGTTDIYVVQWFRDGDPTQLSSGLTLETNFIVSGLLPATDYQFRVITQYNPQDELWLMYSLPDFLGNDTMDSMGELRAPKYLHQDFITSTSTRLSWDRVSNAKFYTVCYVPTKDDTECEDGDFVKSYSPKVEVSKLQPNTEYIFKVRTHDSNSVPGGLSQPFIVRTPADVPSPVIDLGFNSLNSTTVCIYWQPPQNKSGPIENYVVSYTTDQNWSLEHLLNFTVAADQKKSQNCRENNKTRLISTFLTNLSTDYTYLVMVRAANEVGIGQPCPPIIVKTFDMSKNPNGMLNGSDVAANQRLGIVLGLIMAALCILCCVMFILLRRRCLKRRANTRARSAMSSNYHPALAHYTSQLGTVQVRMEEPCSMDQHEIEQLVAEEPSSHIPPATPEQLDTKGARDLPNGCVNGIGKHSHVNGKVLNGDVRITENPQYYAFECNGNLAKNKSEPLLRRYEEDSNSNVKPSKFYDFYKFFDNAKKHKQSPNKNGNLSSKSNGSSMENSLNSTQLSFLEDSITSNRRLSPVLEPNG